MRFLVLSASTVVIACGLVTVGAQENSPLSPDQRAAIRGAIKERLGEEMTGQMADRLAEAADRMAQLPPAQQEAVRRAIRARLGEEIRGRLMDRVVEAIASAQAEGRLALGDMDRGATGAIGIPADKREAIRGAIKERLGEEMRQRFGDEATEQIAERLAEAADRVAQLPPEQQQMIRRAVGERLREEVRARLAERLADQVTGGN